MGEEGFQYLTPPSLNGLRVFKYDPLVYCGKTTDSPGTPLDHGSRGSEL